MIKDITGQIFGKIRVVSFYGKIKNHCRWNCICECGKEIIVDYSNLKVGGNQSCGCFYKSQLHVKDIVGRTFGNLKVLSFSNKDNGRYKWNCLCSCGNKVIVESNQLKSGRTKSCGCMRNVQKCLSATKIYNIWGAMIQRCCDKECSSYKNYGAKGITVCERWQNSFLDFYKDMGENPKGMTLDRIDFNGNYCKDNCRWATMKQQQRNRSDNHVIEALGKKQTLAEWSEETGIKQETIRARLKSNWLVEKALTEKVVKWQRR